MNLYVHSVSPNFQVRTTDISAQLHL